MYAKSNDGLLIDGDLVATLDAHLRRVQEKINQIPKDQFMVSSEDEIIAHIYSQMYVKPIELLEDAIVMDQEETQINVSEDRNRYISERSRPFLVSGIKVTISIPFTGDENLMKSSESWFT